MLNRKTHITASVLGAILGLAGILNHGIFEIMQGNVSTPGLYIEAIGEAQRFWLYGSEGAVTLVPNFLFTGIITVLIGLAVILWSLRFMSSPKGASVFLLLMILMTLTGGGIGHIVFYVPVWLYARRIRKPLSGRIEGRSEKTTRILSSMWPWMLSLTVICWLIVMELGIFGYVPGMKDPDSIMSIVYVFLFSTVIFTNFAFITAAAADTK